MPTAANAILPRTRYQPTAPRNSNRCGTNASSIANPATTMRGIIHGWIPVDAVAVIAGGTTPAECREIGTSAGGGDGEAIVAGASAPGFTCAIRWFGAAG